MSDPFKRSISIRNRLRCGMLTLILVSLSSVSADSPAPTSPSTTPISHSTTIVSLAPNLTEIVFCLGEGHRVIGVSDFDMWPEQVRELPKLGGYFNPDIEKLLRLRPDIIFLLRGRNELKDRLETLGFTVYDFTCETLRDIQSTIREIGRILDADEASENQVRKMNEALKSVKMRFPKIPSAMICIGMTPGVLQNIYVAGGASFHNDVLEAIGIRNVFKDSAQAYFPINREAVIAAQPDIIIDLAPGVVLDEGDRIRRLDTWKSLKGVPAVSQERIIILTDEFMSIPGPRIILLARQLADQLQLICNKNNGTP